LEGNEQQPPKIVDFVEIPSPDTIAVNPHTYHGRNPTNSIKGHK
jgi:hypothetical protein